MANLKPMQLEKYMKETEFFKLKDFHKTNWLHWTYKQDKFEQVLKEFWHNTSDDFYDYIFDHNCFNPYRYMPTIVAENPSKSNIRQLATEINSIMRNNIESEIAFRTEWEIALNQTELNRFTIRVYLKYYNEINEAMKRILKDYVLWEDQY